VDPVALGYADPLRHLFETGFLNDTGIVAIKHTLPQSGSVVDPISRGLRDDTIDHLASKVLPGVSRDHGDWLPTFVWVRWRRWASVIFQSNDLQLVIRTGLTDAAELSTQFHVPSLMLESETYSVSFHEDTRRVDRAMAVPFLPTARRRR
jgi:hypothetical protein